MSSPCAPQMSLCVFNTCQESCESAQVNDLPKSIVQWFNWCRLDGVGCKWGWMDLVPPGPI